MNFIKRVYKSFMAGPVYIIAFGLVFYGIGAGLTYKQSNYEREGLQAQGEVISLNESCDDEGCTYAPSFASRLKRAIHYLLVKLFFKSPCI